MHCNVLLKGSATRLRAQSSSTSFITCELFEKIENVDLNSKYAADVEAMLLEQSIGRGSEAERLDSSDSDKSLSCIF